MPTWRRISPIDINDQLYRVNISEVWRADDLSVDLPDGEELINSVPVQKGQLHPDPQWSSRGCICVGKRLIYGPIRRTARVLVMYDSYVRFRLNYAGTNRVNTSNLNLPLRVPVFVGGYSQSDPITGQPIFDRAVQLYMTELGVRPSIRRIFTTDRTGNADLISAAITPNIRKRYFLRLRNGAAGPPVSVDGDPPRADGINVILYDWNVADLGNGFNRIMYEFRWFGAVPEIGGKSIGSAIDLPALGELDEWEIPFGNPEQAIVNRTLKVIRGLDFYQQGDVLP